MSCHFEGAFVATDTCPGGWCQGESRIVMTETLRFRSHRPEAVSLREGDIFETNATSLLATQYEKHPSALM